MIDLPGAIAKLDIEFARDNRPGITFVIDRERTQEVPWGWVLFIATQEYLETRDLMKQQVGGGPIFVVRETGEIRMHGSGHDREPLLSASDKGRGLCR